MSTILYCRVSTQAQADDTSLDTQADAGIKYAQDHNLNVSRTVKEVFSGASLFERPQLNAIRDEIRAGSVTNLVIYAVDRLSREIAHLCILLDEFERYGATLHIVTETLDSTAEGALMMSVRGYVAKVEREKIKERTMRGRRAKALNGTLSYARPLFGYRLDEAGRRQIDPVTSPVVIGMFNDVMIGMSLRGIADRLNESGIETPGGNIWWGVSVAQLLKNTAYKGETVLFQETKAYRYEKGRRVLTTTKNDPESHVTLAGATPPLVEPALFDKVQLRISANKKGKRSTPKHQFLLRGRIRCGDCGRWMSAQYTRGWRGYTCSSRQNIASGCRIKTLNAEIAEVSVWSEVSALIQQPGRMQGYIQRVADRTEQYISPSHVTSESIEKQIIKLRKEITTISQRAADASDELWGVFAERIKERDSEVQRLTALQADLKPALTLPKIDLKEFESYRTGIIKTFDTLKFQERVTVLDRLGINLHWNGTLLKAEVYALYGCNVDTNGNNSHIEIDVLVPNE